MPIMAHHAHVRPVHCENLQRRLNPDLPEIDCNVLLLVRHCECGYVSRRRIGPPDWRPSAPTGPGDAVRNPAQVSFWLLEPAADAAMTYFYAQLFAMDTEIRVMFPAAMDVQRRPSSGPSAISPLPKRASRTATASGRIFGNSAARPGIRRSRAALRGVQARADRDTAAVRGAPLERDHEARPGDAPSPADTGRRTRRSAARRLRPPPCRTSASPARPAAPSRSAWGS